MSNFTMWLTTNLSSPRVFPDGPPRLVRDEDGLQVGTQLVLCVLIVLIMVVSFLGNVIVCLIVYQKPPMRSAINLLLANLAMTHILTAVLPMPLTLVSLMTARWLPAHTSVSRWLSHVECVLHNIFGVHSVAMLFVISIDRYLIIVKRKDKLTPWRAKVIISICWVQSVLVCLPSFLGLPPLPTSPTWTSHLVYLTTLQILTHFLPYHIMVYVYIQIVNNMRNNMKKVSNDLLAARGQRAHNLGMMGVSNTAKFVKVDMKFKTEAFATILILFAVLVVCWLPYAVYVLHSSYSGRRDAAVTALFFVFTYAHCALNPVIYSWRIKKFRTAITELVPLARWRCCWTHRIQRKVNPTEAYEMPCTIDFVYRSYSAGT